MIEFRGSSEPPKTEVAQSPVKSTSGFCDDVAPNGRAHCQKWAGHRSALHAGHAMTKWSIGPFLVWR